MLKALHHVREASATLRVVVTEYAKLIHPMMRRELIQRRVVESRHQLGSIPAGRGPVVPCLRRRVRHHQRPRLLLARPELRREMLPLQVELLVAPRHVHVARHQIRTVLAHLRDVQREPAAHRLRHRAL